MRGENLVIASLLIAATSIVSLAACRLSEPADDAVSVARKTRPRRGPTKLSPPGRAASRPHEPLFDELNPAGFKCGRVPMYEMAYSKSINETLSADDEGQFRIVHGLDTITGEWPWIARVSVCGADQDDETGCGSCTGTLLNSRWLITAGHCDLENSTYEATFGLYDLVEPEEDSFTVKVDKRIRHPNYNNLTNDLMLMRLERALNFSSTIQPACLVPAGVDTTKFASSRRCYNVGYGLTLDAMDALRLQKLQVSARAPQECNSDPMGAVHLRNGTVCIGPPAGKIGGSCKGDSGGPDLCYDARSNQWSIFGTVSYGPANCDREQDEKWLTVSVDLAEYRHWIVSTIMAAQRDEEEAASERERRPHKRRPARE